jgi:hypothetical protein
MTRRKTAGFAINLAGGGQCSIFVPSWPQPLPSGSPISHSTISCWLRCDRRAQGYSRAGLGALVGLGARLHLIGLHRELWCRKCGEPPFHGWVTTVNPSRV